MSIPRLAISRPVTVLMVVLAVILFGVISLGRLGLDLLPDISFPMNAVLTVYPGADAETVEKTLTKAVEDAISTANGLRSITSISSENYSLVLAEFNWGIDPDTSAEELSASIDQLSYTLPSDIQKPAIIKFDPSSLPMMMLGVSSDSLTKAELTRIVEEQVVPKLERVEGVARITSRGGTETIIKVLYDPEVLKANGVSEAALKQLLPYHNMLVPVGPVEEDGKRYIAKVGRELTSLEDLKKLVVGVKTPSGQSGLLGMGLPKPIYLEDVADVSIHDNEPEGFTRVNGKTAMLLSVMKRSGQNTVVVSDRLKQALSEIDDSISSISIVPVMDQSLYVRKSINNLASNGVVGGVMAALVLLLFLGSITSTLIISIAIPLSIIVTFVLMYFGNLTLNIMTLGGLALGVGMLVDNAIVVLENIQRHRELGESSVDSAEAGASEVASAITASTLTTLAVFLPVVFIQSIAGHIVKPLSITVSFSLFASLVVSMTVVPLLASRRREKRIEDTRRAGRGEETDRGEEAGREEPGQKELGRVDARQSRNVGSEPGPTVSTNTRMRNVYGRILTYSLNHKALILLTTLVLFLGSLGLIRLLGVEFIPETDIGMMTISISMPAGTPVDTTNKITEEVEDVLKQVPEIATYATQVGSSGASGMLGALSSLSSNKASIDIALVPLSERSRSTNDIAAAIRPRLDDISARYDAASIAVSSSSMIMAMSGGLSESDLSVSILGNDFDTLHRLSNELSAKLAKIEGITNIQLSTNDTEPTALFEVDQAKALLSGLTAAQVGSSVRSQLLGQTVTNITIDGNRLPVVVQTAAAERKDVESVESLKISSSLPSTAGASQSPNSLTSILSAEPTVGRVTTLKTADTLTTIWREDGRRMATLTADAIGIDLGTAREKIQKAIDELKLPEGYEVKQSGMVEIMDESLGSMKLALVLAVVLVYMVMAAQFESLISPLIIMFSIPLAAIGSLFALFITRSEISITSIVGMIVLVGIVVNNAIVIVDFINRLKAKGLSTRQAIEEAGKARLRPILMTALTTILGLFPLAIGLSRVVKLGESDEIQAPLAITIMGGLITSTALTLIVIPVIYELVHARREHRGQADQAR